MFDLTQLCVCIRLLHTIYSIFYLGWFWGVNVMKIINGEFLSKDFALHMSHIIVTCVQTPPPLTQIGQRYVCESPSLIAIRYTFA